VPDAGWLTPPHARKEVKRFGDVRKHNYSQADHAEYLQNPPYRDHSWFHFDSLCAWGFLSLYVSIRGRPSTEPSASCCRPKTAAFYARSKMRARRSF